MTKDEALLEAIEVIEAFERGCDIDDYFMDTKRAIQSCKEALEQPADGIELEAEHNNLKIEYSDVRDSYILYKDKCAELTAKNKELEDRLAIAVGGLDSIASDIDTWHSDKSLVRLIEALNKIEELNK